MNQQLKDKLLALAKAHYHHYECDDEYYNCPTIRTNSESDCTCGYHDKVALLLITLEEIYNLGFKDGSSIT